MTALNSKTCISVFLCLTFSVSIYGQEKKTANTNQSCKQFVGQFYSWYLELKLKDNPTRTSDLALQAKPDVFDPALAQQLREDSDAQEKAGSDLVSLDADAFLGADGPADRYIVKRVTFKDGKCWAEVHGVREHKEGKAPEVTPESEMNNGQWHFINFYFPSPSKPKSWNLLGELKALRESRNPKNDK